MHVILWSPEAPFVYGYFINLAVLLLGPPFVGKACCPVNLQRQIALGDTVPLLDVD